jgi:hypothetical protein
MHFRSLTAISQVENLLSIQNSKVPVAVAPAAAPAGTSPRLVERPAQFTSEVDLWRAFFSLHKPALMSTTVSHYQSFSQRCVIWTWQQPGASLYHHQGGRLCQSERRIHPAAPVRLAGLPDESGVPVVVSGCARSSLAMQIRLDLVQRGNAFAFEIPAAGIGKQRFSDKTALNA